MKKTIIIMCVLGVVSFGVSFAISTFFAHNPNDDKLAKRNQATTAPVETTAIPTLTPVSPMAAKEKQLDDLIAEYRQKLDTLAKKQTELDQWEKRKVIAQDVLKKQAEEVEAMRVQFLAELPNLEKAKRDLEATRVTISGIEAVNLKKAAAVYDKMANAADVLSGMCANNQIDDAARILHYMDQKSAAKVLSEMSDKTLVGKLTDKMTKIKEES